MYEIINKVSSEAVKKATGKNWQEWVKLLDKHNLSSKTHKEIVKIINEKKLVNSQWWTQMVTVGYEFVKGKRITGQTENAGFQIGVQKTLPIAQKKAWVLITSPDGLKIWLGDIEKIKLSKGENFITNNGITGQIRSVVKNTKLRLTWNTKILKS